MCALARLIMVPLVFATSTLAWAAIPTFQDLMDPAVFPEAQCGMTVESAVANNNTVRVLTTGAEIVVDNGAGIIALRQRIGHARPVAALRIGTPLSGVRVTHQGPGFVRIAVEKPSMTLRVNGDSLLLLQTHQRLPVVVERKILPAWHASWKTNHLVVDEFGGFALYCSDLAQNDGFNPLQADLAHYALPANAVLCVGVCPPRAYPWDRSLKEHVVWHWSAERAYPPDRELDTWQADGNVALLQSEVLLWKDWNLDFVPRLGVAEFERVRKKTRELGMRLVVYTSPYYFLKGTSQEKQAVNDKPGVCPGAVTNGENMPLFLDAIRRVMRDLKPDGLYFDGQYIENPAALYALARESRRIVGEKGLLEWHSTGEVGPFSSRMYMPHADVYTDIQLRGECQDAAYGDFDYLRFVVSGYNVHNVVGVLCNNSGKMLTMPTLEALLQANGRLHTLVGQPALREFVRKQYRPRLTPDYRAGVERLAEERQAKIPQKYAAQEAFSRGPHWTETPVLAAEFDAKLPGPGTPVISPANPGALGIQDGCLHIRAHAHTYAFLRIPVDRPAGGFVVKIRQGTDGGMSWGPAALVRWVNGDTARVGLRPGQLEADVLGEPTLGPAHDPQAWVWLRVRWSGTLGAVEYSDDGVTYRQFTTFRRSSPDDVVAELLVGKVPHHGRPEDHTDAGPVGQCDIDFVRLYETSRVLEK
jgi:hypothetical protein